MSKSRIYNDNEFIVLKEDSKLSINDHDSLEDCKATLYCYNKVINKEDRYEEKEYIGKTVKEFLDETWEKVNNNSIKLRIYPNGVKKLKVIFMEKLKTMMILNIKNY